MSRGTYHYLIWSQLFLCLLVCACGSGEGINSPKPAQLAQTYCGSCHLYPSPELLPKSQWKNVLPRMGARMGIAYESFDPFEGKSMQEVFQLQSANIYPASPTVPPAYWDRIQAYIMDQAPDSLTYDPPAQWADQIRFDARFLPVNLEGFPSITMVDIDPQSQRLYLSDWDGNLLWYESDLSFSEHVILPRPIIATERVNADRMRLLSIGQLYPNDSKSGALIELDERTPDTQELLFSGLRRPVHLISTDLNNDGQEDHVVCSFGNMMGELIWLEKTTNTYIEHIIKPVPGATKVYAEDLDQNGSMDLVVLFAQGDEGISIFYNEGGKFREEKVLRFHPLYGCNDFQFLDVDADGDKDLLITNGDNGDHSNVLKPYHGLRVYLNDGQQHFSEQFFFPFHGASMVRAHDFDLDGDIDFALMSFFPDHELAGTQSLVFLENMGDWQFMPYQIPQATEGRWMVMDSGDLDGDGDEDLVFGSFVLNSEGIAPERLAYWRTNGEDILFLENKTR